MIFTGESFGKRLLLFWTIFQQIRDVYLFDCPVLRTFVNETGLLIVNQTATRLPVHCQWLIASSAQQQIHLEFDYLSIPISIKEYLHRGCHRGSVNLWTVGLKHEQIQVCGDRSHVRVGGIGQVLMIELRLNEPRLEAKFLMRYRLMPKASTHIPSTTIRTWEKSVFHPKTVSNDCGLTSINRSDDFFGISSRIVGGRQAIPHSHPWQVLLNNRGKFCGASVLNRHWLITAAHCVKGTEPKQLLVEFGIHDRFHIEHSREARTIKKIIVYPFYNGRSTQWIHDIALLQLSEPLIFNTFIRPICLPSINDRIKVGERTWVTGWGATEDTGNLRYLREVEVPIRSIDQCGLAKIGRDTNLCAGLCPNSTCDACQGDSGGPMIQYRQNRWQLVGLISWGFSCAGLGVYTKVSYYAEWIRQVIDHL